MAHGRQNMYRLSTFLTPQARNARGLPHSVFRPVNTPSNTPTGGFAPPNFLESFAPAPKARVVPPDRGQAQQTIAQQVMQHRIRTILGSPILRQCKADTLHTFVHIGLSTDQSLAMWDFVVYVLGQDRPLKDIEHQIFTRFCETQVLSDSGQYLSLPQSINQKLSGRATIIYAQIAPFLRDVQGHLLDFGCGSGQVAQLIQRQHPHLVVCGVDVADYKDASVTVPIGIFDGHRVPVASGSVDCIVATNVLHHEPDNQQCLDQMQRLLTPDGKLILIETVPVGNSPEAIERDRERTFWNDLIYNHWFNSGDIPVPGTYETPQGWVTRFQNMGFEAVHTEDLGVDQPTIQDTHVLQVYVLGDTLRLIKLVEQAFDGHGGDLKPEREAMGEWFNAHPAFKSPMQPLVSALCGIRQDLPPGEEKERRVHAARSHTLERVRAAPRPRPTKPRKRCGSCPRC